MGSGGTPSLSMTQNTDFRRVAPLLKFFGQNLGIARYFSFGQYDDATGFTATNPPLNRLSNLRDRGFSFGDDHRLGATADARL